MKTDSFSREMYKDGKFIVEEVKQTTYDVSNLSGDAIVTHVGGNGRFKFILNDVKYISGFSGVGVIDYSESNVMLGEQEYFDYSSVVFDRNMNKEWSRLYIHNPSKEYWKPIN